MKFEQTKKNLISITIAINKLNSYFRWENIEKKVIFVNISLLRQELKKYIQNVRNAKLELYFIYERPDKNILSFRFEKEYIQISCTVVSFVYLFHFRRL